MIEGGLLGGSRGRERQMARGRKGRRRRRRRVEGCRDPQQAVMEMN